MPIITSKPVKDDKDPLSIRPNPNRRYETVTEYELEKIGRDIITAKAEIARLEKSPHVHSAHFDLIEWRRTLKMLLAAQKKAIKTAQGRIF